MNILLIATFWIFTVSIYGELDGTYQNLKINTNEFNQTDFLSSIPIHENTTTKELVYKIDGSQNNNDKTLTVHIANPIESNEGVLNFNSESKLANDSDPSSTTTTTEAATTTTTTTASGTNITTNTDTNITTTTTTGATDTAATGNSTISTSSLSNINSTASVTPLPILPKGEPPPTRSAQLGMGLGITFIGCIIIGEIIYFKFFYHGGLSRDDYIA